MEGHSHPHPHPHHHDVGEGAVVLDIGGDVGALVLYTGADMVGAEIEVSKVGQVRTGKHVAVHPRHVGDSIVHAAVYADLTEGDWQLWSPTTGDPVSTVTIVGGEITESRWPLPAIV